MSIEELIKEEMLEIFRTDDIAYDFADVLGYDNILDISTEYPRKIITVLYNGVKHILTYKYSLFTGGLTQYFLVSIDNNPYKIK